jgi:hypothetical protein
MSKMVGCDDEKIDLQCYTIDPSTQWFPCHDFRRCVKWEFLLRGQKTDLPTENAVFLKHHFLKGKIFYCRPPRLITSFEALNKAERSDTNTRLNTYYTVRSCTIEVCQLQILVSLHPV